MNIRAKRLAGLCAALVAVAAVALVLAGCNLQAKSVSESMRSKGALAQPAVSEGLKQEGVLTVGIRSNAAAPFVTGFDPSPVGLDADVAAALADQMGLSVRFCSVTDVREALAGACDVVMGATADDDARYALVGNYADTALALFRCGDQGVVRASDIDGSRIALQDGSSAQIALRITALSITEVATSSLNDAFRALDAQEADFVCCQAASGAYLTLWHAGQSFAGAISAPSPHGVAVAKGSGEVPKAVQAAYDAISENGVLASIRQSWLGNLPVITSKEQIQRIPMRETTGDSLESVAGEDEVLGNAQDGSTAGANAITPLAGWQAASTSGIVATTTVVENTAYEAPSQAYDYDETNTYGYAPSYDDGSYDNAYGDTYDAYDAYDNTYDNTYDATYDYGANADAGYDVTADVPAADAAGDEGYAAPADAGYANNDAYAMADESGAESAATYTDGGNYTESYDE